MSIFRMKLRRDFVAMHPDTVHDTERKHDHERERTAVTDQRQRDTGDGQHCDRHSDILEDMCKNEGGNSDDEKQAELIAGKESHEKRSHQQESKGADEKHAADKTPLLADRRENVIVVHRSGWQKSQLN